MTPMIYVVAGVAGGGKSTFGRALAARCAAALLDQDILTNPLMVQIARMAGAADHDLDHPALAAADVRRARYQCLLDTAQSNLAIGRSVVLIAPFTAEIGGPDAWSATFGHFAPTRVALLWVSVPPDVAAQRRRTRALPRDLAAERTPLASIAPAVPFIAVDGTLPTPVALERTARRLHV